MSVLWTHLGLFAQGLVGTIKISALAGVGAIAVGVPLAVGRVSPLRTVRTFCSAWVESVGNCPIAVVLFFFAFGLPAVGIRASYFALGVSALAVYTAAFVCEAVRSGVAAVPRGEIEAGRAIGLSLAGGLRMIVLPQALRAAIPPLTNTLTAMIKDSAVVGAFGVGGDLFNVAHTLTAGEGFSPLPVLVGVVCGYVVLIVPAALAAGVLDRKLAVHR